MIKYKFKFRYKEKCEYREEREKKIAAIFQMKIFKAMDIPKNRAIDSINEDYCDICEKYWDDLLNSIK